MMNLWIMIWTNLRRHRVRTAIGSAGIALGVATMLSVVSLLGGAVKMFERILRTDSQMVVFEKNVSDLFFSNVPEELSKQLNQEAFVEAARPVLFAVISSKDRPVITCFGVDSTDPRLKKGVWLKGQIDSFNAEQKAVVLGERAADFLEVGSDGKIQLGQDRYAVAGVVRLENGFENGGVFMPLAVCQNAFHKVGTSSVVSVKLSEKGTAAEVKKWVEKHYPRMLALENEEFSRGYSQFRIIKMTAWVVGGCAFMLGGLSVTNTMILSVFGRIRELAIARVCGFSRTQLALMIFGESLLVSILGTILGAGFCVLGLYALKAVPQLQGYIDPQIGWVELLGAAGLAVFTALLGAMYPATYAARLKPSNALRFE